MNVGPATFGSSSLVPLLCHRITDDLLTNPSAEMLANLNTHYQTPGGAIYASDGTTLRQVVLTAQTANTLGTSSNSSANGINSPASLAAYFDNGASMNGTSALEVGSTRRAFMRQVWKRRMARYKPYLNYQANIGTSVAGSTLIYVDPTAKTNGSGMLGSPRNVMPVFASSTTVLIKEGTTWTGSIVIGGTVSNFLLGSYDKNTGGRVLDRRRIATIDPQGGIGCNYSGNQVNTWISGIRFVNFITGGLKGSSSTASGGGIEWCLAENASYAQLPGTIPTCFQNFVDGAVVRFNIVNGVSGDGIWVGQAAGFGSNNVQIYANDVQIGPIDVDGPDSCQLAFQTTAGAIVVKDNWLENPRNRKQVILGGYSGVTLTDSLTVQGNFCFGGDTALPQVGVNPQNGIYSQFPNTVIKGNYVEKASQQIVCDTNPAGTLIYGNMVVIDNLGPVTSGGCIACASPTTAPRIYNNTVIGLRAFPTSAQLVAITSTNKIDCCNNIVVGSDNCRWTRQIQMNAANAGGSLNIKSNCYDSRYPNLFDSGAGLRTPDQTELSGSESLLDSWYRPILSSFLEYSGQTPIEFLEDIYGVIPSGSPAIIGAAWPQVV